MRSHNITLCTTKMQVNHLVQMRYFEYYRLSNQSRNHSPLPDAYRERSYQSSHLTSSDLIWTDLILCAVIGRTSHANWLASQRTIQFAVAETSRSADEMRSVGMRSDEVRWYEMIWTFPERQCDIAQKRCCLFKWCHWFSADLISAALLVSVSQLI